MEWLHSIDPGGQIILMFVSLALGAFVGLRREMELQKEGVPSFVGFRTMPLITLLGTLTTFFPQFTLMPIVGLFTVIAFLLIAYFNGVFQLKLLGLTSEISTLIMYLAGVLTGYGYITHALVITIFVATFAAFKPQMHRFAGTISHEEWAGALQLLIISAIVLPILPREAIDPWGVLVPYSIWLIVIFISAIGFAGYFFNKYLGSRKGILMTSLMGSLVSSTVVTTYIAQRASRDKAPRTELLFMAMVVAIATMLIRVLLVLLVFTPVQYLYPMVLIPLSMIITVSGIGLWFCLQDDISMSDDAKSKEHPTIKSPFEIIPALQFGALFVVVLYAVHFGQVFFGALGVIATTFFSAFVDVDAAIVSVIQNLRLEAIAPDLVLMVITIALVVNTMIKAFYVWIISRHIELARLVFAMTGAASIVAIATYLIL